MNKVLRDYITTKQASEVLNQTRQEVTRKIWRGIISAVKVGKYYLIHKDEIIKLLPKSSQHKRLGE